MVISYPDIIEQNTDIRIIPSIRNNPISFEMQTPLEGDIIFISPVINTCYPLVHFPYYGDDKDFFPSSLS